VRDSAGTPPRGLGPSLTASDVRFTTKGDALYAVVMGKPEDGKVTIHSLATNSPHYPGKIGGVQMLGAPGKLDVVRDEHGLAVTLPEGKTSDYAIALKITPNA